MGIPAIQPGPSRIAGRTKDIQLLGVLPLARAAHGNSTHMGKNGTVQRIATAEGVSLPLHNEGKVDVVHEVPPINRGRDLGRIAWRSDLLPSAIGSPPSGVQLLQRGVTRAEPLSKCRQGIGAIAKAEMSGPFWPESDFLEDVPYLDVVILADFASYRFHKVRRQLTSLRMVPAGTRLTVGRQNVLRRVQLRLACFVNHRGVRILLPEPGRRVLH